LRYGFDRNANAAHVTRVLLCRDGPSWRCQPSVPKAQMAAFRRRRFERTRTTMRGTGEMSRKVRCNQGRIAASVPKVQRSWTRGCRRRVKRAPYEAEARGVACKGVSAVRRHAGGMYDAGSYSCTLVKCLKPFVRNGN
jgi:hypothetical protein